ncbi:hypothetical protein [Cohnella sp. REN36]|uniref:hypothetical protein n=1 Tax=Cohnella sp. REN36 TaxID=2887347 RepID=UPI001D148FF3|nr:hypothetical protein [Cohnella sp. REN36]MCC3373117.1 hypothetical protein [Cohnella sp. REN36]
MAVLSVLLAAIFGIVGLVILYSLIQSAIDQSDTAKTLREIRDLLERQLAASGARGRPDVHSEHSLDLQGDAIGTDLSSTQPDADEVCPGCGTIVSEDRFSCPECGLTLRDPEPGANFR